jgi:hypothetical protein
MPSDPAISTSPPVPEEMISRRTTGTAASGSSISIPARRIISGMLPRVAMPTLPHALQSMAIALAPGRVARMEEVTLHIRSFAAL